MLYLHVYCHGGAGALVQIYTLYSHRTQQSEEVEA